jgi:hypothetical protein
MRLDRTAGRVMYMVHITEPGRIHYIIEEFNIPYEQKRELAEFFNAVRRLYYAAEELREKLASCSTNSSRLSSGICRMSIIDKYIVVKRMLAELNAYNLDEAIKKILEQL